MLISNTIFCYKKYLVFDASLFNDFWNTKLHQHFCIFLIEYLLKVITCVFLL